MMVRMVLEKRERKRSLEGERKRDERRLWCLSLAIGVIPVDQLYSLKSM